MPIKEIGLISFRNHDEIKLNFYPNINVIWGRNGSGKTAILEAIHILSIGRSFRTNRKIELLKEGSEFFSITGKFGDAQKEQVIQINQVIDGTRRILVDENRLDNVSQLVGLNPVVLLSPEEQVITKGAPQEQRNYFNKVFSIISKEYLNVLTDYNKLIKQRNKLLTDYEFIETAKEELEAWNKMLAEKGARLWELRKNFIDIFFKILEDIVKDFDNGSVRLNGNINTKICTSESEYIDKLIKVLKKDLYLGRTTFGPHKDEFKFIFNGKDIKQFGSQGEHKLTLLLIKLAEVQMVKKITGSDPIILLDDLFAKLDNERIEQAMQMISNDLQTIITTTDQNILTDRGIEIDNNHNGSYHLV